MKGKWKGFAKDYGGSGRENNKPVNGKDYNIAGSKSVNRVNSINTVSNSHSMPTSSTPNSVTRNYLNGKLNSERYFGQEGKAYLDIDYSNHGNPATHPRVPHEHNISFDKNNKMHRGKEKGIQK